MASDGGLQPADFGDNFDAQSEREKLRAKLKDDIFSIWRNNKADKYNLGKHLFTLQQLHAKPGYGTFHADLDELQIPHNTAYQRIKFYKKIEAMWEAGHECDLVPVRGPYRFGTDEGGWVDTQYDKDEPTINLKAAADQKQAEIEAIIKAEAEKVAKIRVEQKGKVPHLNLSLVLPKDKRDRLKNKWAQMEEQRRSELVYEAIINASIT